MIFTKEIAILTAIVLLVCLIGFKKYVWFISIGYGLSIAAIGAGMLLLFGDVMDVINIVFCGVLICYGLRLGGYLAVREALSPAYNKKMKGEISDGSGMSLFVKVMIWVSCALLYITMTSPVIYRSVNGLGSDTCEMIAVIITCVGILLEACSDVQKTKAKKLNPGRFCDKGLYAFVRCPNYLGELIIWTGVFVSSFTALRGAGQWVVAVIGYLGIVYVMFSGARRLEIRHDKNYGADKEYIAYKNSTPIMIPFIPLYSVKKHKWLVG